MGSESTPPLNIMAKFDQNIVSIAASWVQVNGLIECGGAKLSDFLSYIKIDQRTYYRWLSEHADFADAIKKAKEEFKSTLEIDIVNSLAKCAKGYEWEQTVTEFADKNGKPVIKKQTKKTIRESPNVAAAIFLLTNIGEGRWVNKQKVESAINGNIPKLSVSVNIDKEAADIIQSFGKNSMVEE